MAAASGAAAEAPAPPMGQPASKLQLIGAEGLDHGRYRVGIEIAMAPGSHTYWKNPGESGVPPVFSFNGSTNVAKAEVAFPVPARMSEDGLEAFGYTDKVVFPVMVTPRDASQPGELRLEATFAVCNKICIPAQGSAALTLPPKGTSEADALSAAAAKVPRFMSEAERANLTIRPDPAPGKAAWSVTWAGADPADDLFVVAPEGFYFSTKSAGPQTWTLSAEQSVTAKNATEVPLSLVVARKDRSLITSETLDLATAKK